VQNIPFHPPISQFALEPEWLFFFQSSPGSSRALKLHSFWQNHTLPSGLPFTYKFVDLFPTDRKDPPNLALPDNLFSWKSHPNREKAQWTFRHMSGLIWTFDYVLRETTAKWIFRSDDDILINFEMLLPFMIEMENKYDPLTQIIIRGDCIRHGRMYPQGGAGVLLSRRAIEVLLPLGNFSIWGFWEDSPDKRLGRLMEELDLQNDDCSSSVFLGESLSEEDLERVMNGQFKGLKECPKVRCVQRGCYERIGLTSQLVFYHVGNIWASERNEFEKRIQIAEKLWRGPKELAVFHDGGYGRELCWLNDKFVMNDLFGVI
jgi:hypothetical protein